MMEEMEVAEDGGAGGGAEEGREVAPRRGGWRRGVVGLGEEVAGEREAGDGHPILSGSTRSRWGSGLHL